MRKLLLAVLLSVACVVHHVSAAPVESATVTAIDDVARTFRCRWKTKDWTFQTTKITVFLAGTRQAEFGDLRVGQTVNVSYHRTGGGRTADRVVIIAK